MAKRESILEQLADKTRKPDALGFRPIDPKMWVGVVRCMERNRG